MKKTDKKDAETLALFLSKDMIPEVRMKDKKYSEIESVANTRDKLVKLRTALKNKIHNILSSYGIITKKKSYTSEKNMDKVLKVKVSETAKLELKIIVDQIKSLNKGIKELEKKMVEKGKQLEGFENITSIKGIGEKGGTILLSAIGNVNDFISQKKLDAYIGIVPRVNQSNETTHYGRITKKGINLPGPHWCNAL